MSDWLVYVQIGRLLQTVKLESSWHGLDMACHSEPLCLSTTAWPLPGCIAAYTSLAILLISFILSADIAAGVTMSQIAAFLPVPSTIF